MDIAMDGRIRDAGTTGQPMLRRAPRAARARWGGGSLIPLLALGWLTGCGALDKLLDVDLSGQIETTDAEAPAKAATLVEGGITLFNCALMRHIIWGGAVGDEVALGSRPDIDSRNLATDAANATTDSRPCGGDLYRRVAQARWQNDRNLQLLEGWSDAEVTNRVTLIARAAAYSGYSHLLLAEGFCTAALDGGPEIQPADVFQRTEARFTRAIEAATAAANTVTLNLARVGRARARLDLARYADARADGLLVPAAFVETAKYPANSPGVNENEVYGQQYVTTAFGIDALYWDLRFAGVPDPRVRVVSAGRTFGTDNTPFWRATKYTATTSPIELATGTEALLIVAEADARAGSLGPAVATINQLHTAAGLPSFSSTDQAQVVTQIMYERRAELFLEGQHLGDYRRYPLPFNPLPGTPYLNNPGRLWGTSRCYPLPSSERSSNPNIE